MMRLLSSVLLLLGIVTAAQGHFVFIVPQDGTRNAQVVFSDSLKPDDAELLSKVSHTTYRVSDGKGGLKDLRSSGAKDRAAFDLTAPGEGPAYIVGQCLYGVITRGKEPFLLTYHARAVVGLKAGEKLPEAPAQADGLVVVPQLSGKEGPSVDVLWQGKPLADAEVVFLVPGREQSVTAKTDNAGRVKLAEPAKAGLYAVRARHVEEKKGEHDGKKYTSARSYATLVFPVTAGGGKPSEDPEASKLLADARAARANWDHFPGFAADVAVNVDGKVSRGKVKVSSKGKVELELEGPQKEWARRMLASLVGHRMDGATTLNTPCAFEDGVTEHPLGRAIRVLNDEHHSSYRVRDRQIIEVNRHMGEVRFTISVLENLTNAEKKFLPATYVVNTWDAKTGALRSSAAHHHAWKRVGKFDLPASVTTVTAEAGRQVSRKIELTKLELAE